MSAFVIGYVVGALIVGFVLVVLSVLTETEAESMRTARILPLAMVFWPFSVAVLGGALVGDLLKRAAAKERDAR